MANPNSHLINSNLSDMDFDDCPLEDCSRNFAGWDPLPEAVDCIMDYSNLEDCSANFSGWGPSPEVEECSMDVSNVQFDPPLVSSMNTEALSSRLQNIGNQLGVLIFSTSGEESRERDDTPPSLNDESILSEVSDRTIDDLDLPIGVPPQRRDIAEESMLDISTAFNVVEGNACLRPLFIVKGSRTGGPLIVSEHQGFELVKNKEVKKGTMLSMRCKHSTTEHIKCKAMCHMSHPDDIMRAHGDVPGSDGLYSYFLEWGTNIFKKHDQHSENCPMIPGNREKILFLNECKNLALKDDFIDKGAMVIVEAARAIHVTPDTITDHFPDAKNTCKMINRWKFGHRARPPRVDGSDILGFELQVDRLHSEVPNEFYRGAVTSVSDGVTSKHFIFFSDRQLFILCNSRTLIVDATFSVVREPHYQLLVIHASTKRPNDAQGNEVTVNLPVAFALMQNKTQSAYIAVFRKIKDVAEQSGGVPMKVNAFMVDYEKAIWNAMRSVWAGVVVRGCWFHFCQCIYRKVQDLKMARSFLTVKQVHHLVKRLMALALVDAANIPLTFNYLKLKYQREINDPLFTGVKALFDYFEAQWISGATNRGFVPADYTCYREIIRTTNIAESFNGELYQSGDRKSHNIYQLSLLLARETSKCLDNIDQYAAKQLKKRKAVEKQKAIVKAWNTFDVNRKPWDQLENLRRATTEAVNYTIAELTSVIGELLQS